MKVIKSKTENNLTSIQQNKESQFLKYMQSQKGPNKHIDFFSIFCAGYKSGYNYHRTKYGHLPVKGEEQ